MQKKESQLRVYTTARVNQDQLANHEGWIMYEQETLFIVFLLNHSH